MKDQVAAYITTEWLGEHVIPSIAKRYEGDSSLIQNLGLATLYALRMDMEVTEDLCCCSLTKVKAVREAYAAIPVEIKPEQPVLRAPLHVYCIGESVHIDEVWSSGDAAATATAGNQGQPATVADNLARIPASGGSDATQQVLQTLLIQNQQLTRQIQDMEKRLDARDMANRSWLARRQIEEIK